MSFAAPVWLLTLLLVPVALAAYVWAQQRRSRYAARFTNLDLLASVVARGPDWRRHVPPALFLVALSVLLLAAARPEREVSVPKEQATVVLVMDVSGSMMATDVEPSRLVAAREAANAFLDDIPEPFRVGVVAFAESAQLALPPTDDRDLARDALERLRASGGTAMGDAILLALDAAMQLSEDEPPPADGGTPTDPGEAALPPTVLLLLSDGFSTAGNADPLDAAQRAQELGVPVFTVALGTPGGIVDIVDNNGVLRRIPVPPDEETLAAIADITGAQFFDAASQGQLKDVYEGLSSKLGYDTEEREITWLFAAVAAGLLVVGSSLSLFWFNRFP